MARRNKDSSDCLPTISESLTYLCTILSPFGVTQLSPRNLLSAAANEPSASPSIWSALHQLICLQLASPSSSKPVANVLLCRLQEVDRDHLRPHDVTVIVKFYLSLWGFPFNSRVFSLCYDTGESQNLLLPLAWLISRCDIFKRALDARIENLSPRSFKVFPFAAADVSKTMVAAERARQARTKSEIYIQKLVATSSSLPDIGLRAKARSQQTLMLYGRVRMALMALHSSVSARAKFIHKLNHMQRELKIKDQDGHAFSQLDVHILEHKEILDKDFEALQAGTHVGKEVEMCELHEKTFWQWMVSVVVSRESQGCSDQEIPTHPERLKVLSEFCTTSIIPVVEQLKHYAVAQENLVRVPRDPKSMEIQVDSQMLNLEQLSVPVMVKQEVPTFLPKVLFPLHEVKFTLESAPTGGLPPTADSDAESIVERLKLIATALVQVHAKIRSRNRICLEEAMSKYTTQDYVLHNFWPEDSFIHR
ncbi:hypothetical protein R1sor_003340 [Riccia sorocarpa]|uniref:Tubulin epsilon and delta complex protein 1 domain-containing protein n=1 Tax=Riccia sorocarpa TaxID=122646 RepID=A0ABD3H1Q1_9MARC